MTTEQAIALIIAAFGTGGLATQVIPGLWRWITGKQARERDLIRKAYAEADAEARERRRLAEEVATLRLILIRQGLAHLIPPSTAQLVDESHLGPSPSSIIESPRRTS